MPPRKRRTYEELRPLVWGKGSVKLPKRNPVAKELLQGDGRLAGKVIDKQEKKPRYGKQEWLKQLDEEQED